MSDSNGTVIESQVDWLTVSAHGNDRARELLDYALAMAKDEERRGAKRKRWRSMGYEGWHVGKVEYGQRDTAATELRLIGQAAADHLDVALSLADAVTRADIALTWRADPPDRSIGLSAYAQAEQHWQVNTRRARPLQIRDPSGGFTLQIGSRESENFLRLYNKEAECREKDDDEGAERYAACWRYELETKGGLASNLAQTVVDQEDRPAYVRSYLYNYCTAHGLTLPFDLAGNWALLPGFRRRSDEETKLRHLARNVRPTVEWLVAKGRGDEVRTILGLS